MKFEAKMTVDNRRMSDADRAGFVARSPEGHAARSMHIKGQEEVWIGIQVGCLHCGDFYEPLRPNLFDFDCS